MKGRKIKVIVPLEKFECARQEIELSEDLRIREIIRNVFLKTKMV